MSDNRSRVYAKGSRGAHDVGGDKEGVVALDGLVTEALPNTQFRVVLDNNQVILGYVSGKIRKHRIRILPGDKVTVEMSPYDLTKGRITKRLT